MGVIGRLGPGPIAFDTAPIIYLIEEHPRFGPLVSELFDDVAKHRRRAVTSAITLLEVLVVPYRLGRVDIATQYEALLTGSSELDLIDIDTVQLRLAAQLRAEFGLRTPDALQIAAARSAGCSTFITNDHRIPTMADLRVVTLTELLSLR